jgi:chemotaxis protein methyltransferase CheR
MTASPTAIAVLAALLEARTGQQIASYRTWRLDTALTPLLRERGLASLDELVTQLLDGRDHHVGDRIVEALLNGESSFFRDPAVFDQVAAAVAAHDGQGRRLRIWSAGCATGQEPLSLAMIFAERLAEGGPPVPEIVATDISEASLARARAGRYTQFEIQRGLPIRRMMRWFDGDPGGDWIAHSALTQLVHYRRLNLVADRPPAGQFDVVLCRNVLLYLSAPLKERVFAMLAGALRPGGTLFLGAGETVIGQTGLFEPSRRFRGAYDRTGLSQARAAA